MSTSPEDEGTRPVESLVDLLRETDEAATTARKVVHVCEARSRILVELICDSIHKIVSEAPQELRDHLRTRHGFSFYSSPHDPDSVETENVDD